MPRYRHTQPVVPEGEYDVTVMSATEGRSKSGNEMIVLRLSAEGSKHWFSEHLVFSDASYWKIAQFLTAIGKHLKGDEDIKPEDCLGRTARAIVGVKEFGGRSENVIKKWLPAKQHVIDFSDDVEGEEVPS
jgi:Protein of unknown function (DUF669)